MDETGGNSGEKPAGRDAKGRFRPGNPGKPKGSRHRATQAVERMLHGEAEALTRRAIEAALAGDPVALRLCLDRIAPRREARVHVALPPVRVAADLPGALGSILAAVASGELTPGEAERIGRLLGETARALELTELGERIAALERRE